MRLLGAQFLAGDESGDAPVSIYILRCMWD